MKWPRSPTRRRKFLMRALPRIAATQSLPNMATYCAKIRGRILSSCAVCLGSSFRAPSSLRHAPNNLSPSEKRVPFGEIPVLCSNYLSSSGKFTSLAIPLCARERETFVPSCLHAFVSQFRSFRPSTLLPRPPKNCPLMSPLGKYASFIQTTWPLPQSVATFCRTTNVARSKAACRPCRHVPNPLFVPSRNLDPSGCGPTNYHL
jgi:hypothetical protein